MKEEVIVSVLITTYNLEKYIRETLESVFQQKTNFKYEILIGDDGSCDNTVQIIKKYQERFPERIRLFIMDREPNKKYNKIERVSRSRVNLLRNARGKYFIFLDGDDFYTDELKLQKQVDMLEQDEYKQCVACAHNVWMYWSDEKKYPINRSKRIKVISGKKYWKNGMYVYHTIMYRNVFLNEVLKDEVRDYFDDNMILFYMFQYGNIVYIPDVMSVYRQVDSSSWNTTDDVERQIINLIDLDIERKVNKSFEKESYTRHLYNIFYLWLHKREITSEIKEKYAAQIKRDNLEITKKWIEYKDKSISKRMRMSAWLMGQLITKGPGIVLGRIGKV